MRERRFRRRHWRAEPELEWEQAEISPRARSHSHRDRLIWIVPGVALLGTMLLVLPDKPAPPPAADPAIDSQTPFSLDLLEDEEPIAGPASPAEIGSMAKTLMLRFFDATATSWEEREELAVSASAEEMKNYYARPGKELRVPVRFIDLRAIAHNGRRLLVCRAEDAEGTEIRALLEQHGEGLKLHWKPTVGYGEMTWNEFIAQRPQVPIQMRMKLYPLAPPAGPGGSESMPRFTVSHPDLAGGLIVYLPDRSESADWLRMQREGTAIPVNALVAWRPGDAEEACLVSIIHPGWIR